MACSLTTGRAALTGCGATKAGLNELQLWFIDRSDWTNGSVSATTGVATSFTAGSVLLPFAFDSRGFSFTEPMSTDANTGAQTHKPNISGRLIGLNGLNRADTEKLKGTNLVAIIGTKAQKFLIVGRTAGLTLDTLEVGSASENLGHLIGMSNTEDNPESESYCELLMTDYATTLAALVAAE